MRLRVVGSNIACRVVNTHIFPFRLSIKLMLRTDTHILTPRSTTHLSTHVQNLPARFRHRKSSLRLSRSLLSVTFLTVSATAKKKIPLYRLSKPKSTLDIPSGPVTPAHTTDWPLKRNFRLSALVFFPFFLVPFLLSSSRTSVFETSSGITSTALPLILCFLFTMAPTAQSMRFLHF